MARTQLTTDQIVSILETTPGRLEATTAGLPERRLRARPAPDEWSLTEILAHLRACADVWGEAIETIIRTDHPTIRAINPTTWIERTDYRTLGFASSLRAFSAQRLRLLEHLREVPPPVWARGATVLGGGKPLELTLTSYASRLARHERTHWRQVEKTVKALRPD